MNLKTTLHIYWYDISKPADATAYAELCAKLKGLGLRVFETWSMKPGQGHYKTFADLDGREIELETAHLFDNQWNTAPIDGFSDKGHRVFDWAQEYVDNKKIKAGHWLDQTPEMVAIRRETRKCGYCGTHYPKSPENDALVFCTHCLDSEYLSAKDLPLLRLMPVACDGPRHDRPTLSEAELAPLRLAWSQAQIHGNTVRGKARIAKQRVDIQHKAELAIDNAKTERDGLLWLLDHGINIDNVIYYNHTGKFCFGWRKPIDKELYSELVNVLCEFCFDYEIKTTGVAQ